MSRTRSVRLRLSSPPWIDAWPVGLRPSSLVGTPEGVELRYAPPSGSWVGLRVRVTPTGLDVGVVPSAFPDHVAVERLRLAVARRLERSGPQARAWARRVVALCVTLSAEQDAGAVDGVLAAARRLCVEEAAPGREEIVALERALGAARAAAPLGLLACAAGDVEQARSLWMSLESGETLASRVALAVRDAIIGLQATIDPEALELTRLARDDSEHSRCGLLLFSLGRPGAALPHFLAAYRQERTWFALEFIARAAAASGDAAPLERALDEPRSCDELGPAQQVELADALIEAHAHARAEQLLREAHARWPDALEVRLRLAELALWRLRLGEARTLAEAAAERDPEDARALKIIGAAAFLDGDPRTALDRLERAYALAPDDREIRLWRAEVLFALGERRRAGQAIVEKGFDNQATWQLLRALIEGSDRAETLHGGTSYNFRLLLRDVFADSQTPLRFDDDARSLALLRRALSRIGGNRSPQMTFTVGDERRLVSASHVIAPRTRATSLQERLFVDPPEVVLAAFDELARDQAEAPYGITYGAEVRLWLGDYAGALARFERAWQERRTRWGYVGSGAALMLLERGDEALARWEEGRAYFDYLPEEATFAYRGELWRKRGELERAATELEHAVAHNPARLGAWVNLALLQLERGERATQAIAQVSARAPILCGEVARELAVALDSNMSEETWRELLARALIKMRGNRSSKIHTFVDARGRLRVLSAEHAASWVRFAATSAQLARDDIAQAVIDHLLSQPG
ncbi:MAG: tetratricopeptide repeat protein [Myxococcales bacterium]|nr:tetratricopeptide repeat protein [Myxococcales bacterium]